MGARTERRQFEALVDEAVVRMVIWTSKPMPDEVAEETEAELSAKAVEVAPVVGADGIRSILEAARDRVRNRQRERWDALLDSVLATVNEFTRKPITR